VSVIFATCVFWNTPGAAFVIPNAASQPLFKLSADGARYEKQALFVFTWLFSVSVPEAIELLLFAVSAWKFANVPLKPK